MLNKRMPHSCPACTAVLEVTQLGCPACKTLISGNFPLPELLTLNCDEQQFVLDFVRSSGSLKLMAQNLKLSYPTVRNMLDDIIEKLNQQQS